MFYLIMLPASIKLFIAYFKPVFGPFFSPSHGHFIAQSNISLSQKFLIMLSIGVFITAINLLRQEILPCYPF